MRELYSFWSVDVCSFWTELAWLFQPVSRLYATLSYLAAGCTDRKVVLIPVNKTKM